jgi:hypothetical protein
LIWWRLRASTFDLLARRLLRGLVVAASHGAWAGLHNLEHIYQFGIRIDSFSLKALQVVRTIPRVGSGHALMPYALNTLVRMLGQKVSDLERGDVLGPVDHLLTPFMVREYAHAVEEFDERHHRPVPEGLLAPPTMVHADKVRLLGMLCPDQTGPARLHVVYDATHHQPVPASRVLSVTGTVVDRYDRKGRDHIEISFEVRDKATGVLYTTYRDTTIMAYRAG